MLLMTGPHCDIRKSMGSIVNKRKKLPWMVFYFPSTSASYLDHPILIWPSPSTSPGTPWRRVTFRHHGLFSCLPISCLHPGVISTPPVWLMWLNQINYSLLHFSVSSFSWPCAHVSCNFHVFWVNTPIPSLRIYLRASHQECMLRIG